ncbi:MAG: methyltransferase domain-containing protein [Candidatus Gottesmanbacteria bacterium]|nr:methyltransferase domain-containing protein [Candidatus Gottesmanbacteria bacterium]
MKQNTEELIKRHAYFNRKFFARWAPYYDLVAFVLKPLRYDAARRLQLPHDSRVLDVATGTGEQALALAKAGYDVTGIDLSPDMLKRATKKRTSSIKLKFVHSDATQLPFTSNSFDATTISFALHDMPYEIRLLVLKEMIRVTKNNGIIMTIDYLEPSKGLLGAITYRFVRRFETPMYEDFIHKGLLIHLTKVGLVPQTQTTLFIGQIKICKNKK